MSSQLSPQKISELLSRLPELVEQAEQELLKRDRENRLQSYRPYPKQMVFHAAGAKYRERLLRAGNQQGKSLAGAAEVAYHATGDYPHWWDGRRFEQATNGWIGGPSGELVRDGTQHTLLGPPGDWGTGTLPKATILDIARATGIRDAVDSVTVKHINGSASRIKFKTYDQGRERWQAAKLDWLWFDEEPPIDIYLEGISRTNATRGLVWLTFTPLLGVSDVVMRFLKETSPDRHDTVMTIEDALHIPVEERRRIIDSYPPHEREARTRGIPMLGSGRIFPFPREMLTCEAIPIPPHWAKIGGLDFGWDHPTAAVRIAHDRDADVVYVTDCYRVREQPAATHAAALRAWGLDLPWAWPHDGLQHDKTSGDQLADLYKRNGLNMLWEHAQFDDERGFGVEAGNWELLDRMQTGRLKIFAHLNDLCEEIEMYHRLDGKIVKERDDAISALRYAVMMLRHAKAGRAPRDPYARPLGRRNPGSWMAA